MEIKFTKQAEKDFEKIKQFPALKSKLQALLDLISEKPFENPPSYEKLLGLRGIAYSRRINQQHRLVYTVYEKENIIVVIRCWTHYE